MIGYMVRVSAEKLEQYKSDSSLFETDFHANMDEDWVMDLEKNWDGIQYILTGESVMLGALNETVESKAFFSNQVLDETQDLGYGPAQYLHPVQVKEINEVIQKMDAQSIAIDGADMEQKQVYPTVWAEDEAIEYLRESFEEFQGFYKEATNNNQAILTLIS